MSNLNPGKQNSFSGTNTRIQREKKLMFLSIIESVKRSIESNTVKKEVSRDVLKLWGEVLLNPRQKNQTVKNFYLGKGSNPPFLLVISPGHACNLACKDCYAASDYEGTKLPWDMLDRIITEAKKSWGIKLVVFSGGEPFMYRSQGKDIIDIALKNPDLLFLAFTNGTLIDASLADRISDCRNLTPAFSVEGMKETTDARRGEGIFNKVVGAMEKMKKAGIPFGISVTVSRKNYIEVFSEEFLDFFFLKMGVFYGFYFQYLPIGRNADFILMPTPAQRLESRERIWSIIEQKKYFILDFWNHGPLVKGCIAAGRDGGYLHIDWNGNVMPCVFTPFSAGNILDVYKNGGTLMDIWEKPFMASIRKWQKNMGHGLQDIGSQTACRSNLLTPCPYRDHYEEFMEMVQEYSPAPEYGSTAETMLDSKYRLHMREYDKEIKKLFDPLWKLQYLDNTKKKVQ